MLRDNQDGHNFKEMVDKLPMLISHFLPDGTITYVNEAYCRSLNQAREQLTGTNFLHLIPDPLYENVISHIKAITPDSPIFSYEHHLSLPDGALRWEKWTTHGVFDAENNLLSYIAIGEDITERKKAEELINKNLSELTESRNLLKHILNLLPVRIFWKDMNLCYLGCNKLFAEDAGLEYPEQLIGKDDYVMGWKEQADLYRADDRKVIDKKIQKINFEEPQTTPNGEKIWLSTSKVPLTDEQGNVIGVLGVYADVTKRKNAEDRIQELVLDLQQFRRTNIDRENKMLELKKEVNQLSRELGREAPYDLSFLKNE